MQEIIKIKKFNKSNATELAMFIEMTLLNSKLNYSSAYIQKTIEKFSPELILKRATWQNIYVAFNDKRLVGCGAIGPHYDSLTESHLFSIFVDPRIQRKGLGTKIVQTLLNDELATRATRIEVDSAITAVGFYRKLGFSFVGDHFRINDEGLVKMEMFQK